MNYNVAVEARFTLHAFISREHVLQPSQPTGSLTFTKIFQRRYDHYRYAVLGSYSVPENKERIYVIDLFDVKMSKPQNMVVMPKPKITGWDVDAAIVAAQMLYDVE